MVNEKIESYFTSAVIESAKKCAQRLIQCLPDQRVVRNNRVLLAYGGGKDSGYMVAWVIYIRGIVLLERGETFRLRIVTNRHAGMNHKVMDNIDSVYRSLGVYDLVVSKIAQQLSCVVCLQECTSGGVLRIFKKKWRVEDEYFKVKCELGYSGGVVEGCGFCEFSPHLGDIYMFNPDFYHEIDRVVGATRITLGFFSD